LVQGGCDSTASLTPGHSVDCTVLFSTPASSLADHLSYQLPDGTVVTAPLTTKACSLCGGECVDLQTDPYNCGACGVNVSQGGGSCSGGKPVCSAGGILCGGSCIDTQGDPGNCGGCGHTCASHTCLQGHCATEKTSTTQESCATLCGALGCLEANALYHDPTFTCSSGEFPLTSCSEVAPSSQSANGCSYAFDELLCECGK
ncbi:MAG: hypothetical protein ACRELB_18335, partial [Polyangiaceae bacterium]